MGDVINFNQWRLEKLRQSDPIEYEIKILKDKIDEKLKKLDELVETGGGNLILKEEIIMIDYIIKKTLTKMILSGELKFTLNKGFNYIPSPNEKIMKRVPTLVLNIKDKNNTPLSISEILLEDVICENSDLN